MKTGIGVESYMGCRAECGLKVSFLPLSYLIRVGGFPDPPGLILIAMWSDGRVTESCLWLFL
jgi:hypothetical protein